MVIKIARDTAKIISNILHPYVVLSLVMVPFILLLGVSRYYLGEHTPLQLTTGFLLGLVFTIAVFQGFAILE